MQSRQLVPLALVATAAAATPVAIGATRPKAHTAQAKVAVAAREFKFNLRPTSARHGTVTFRLMNVGRIGHDFKIANKKTPVVNPGKSAVLTVPLKAGTYPYVCTVPGHAASGMKGTFRVT
jgi:uncharacterized cupredoxin-like copper-binding protein